MPLLTRANFCYGLSYAISSLLALNQYEKNVAILATDEKRELVDLLNSQAPSDEALDETSLTQVYPQSS